MKIIITAVSASLILLLYLLSGCENSLSDFYISPSGSDDNPGTIDQPFASLERARNCIRELNQKGKKNDIAVYLREGTYYLTETLILGLEDAAPEGYRITYCNYPGERPIISSGVKITGWIREKTELPGLPANAEGRIWSASLPEGISSFYTLFEGDSRLPRAVTEGFHPTQSNRESKDLYHLHFPHGKIKNWPRLEDVEIVILPQVPWTMNILPIEFVDVKNNIAKMKIPATYPLTNMPKWANFPEGTVWVENVFEGLDKPGEWVLDSKNRKVYLWPVNDTPGENIQAPKLTVLIKVAGETRINEPKDIPVKGIHFKGLTFTHAARNIWGPDESGIQHDWEVEDKDNAMLRFRGAEECSVNGCHFYNAGGNAIRLDYHAQQIEIRNNLFHDLGASAVVMLGYGPGTKDVNKYNIIENNHIYDCGQIWWHSQMITIWQSGKNLISHNYIHHVPRKAICITGVRPNFFQSDRKDQRECRKSIRFSETGGATELKDLSPFLHARDNIVEYNHIHHVLERMGDGAAINISGAGLGNIICYNYIHDINNPLASANIRTDNAQNGTIITCNIVYRSITAGISAKCYNEVHNNLLIDVSKGSSKGIIRALGNFGNSDVIKNVFISADDQDHFYTFIKDAKPPDVYRMMSDNTVDSNIYFSVNNLAFRENTILTDLVKYGFDQHSLYADPLFENWREGNFRLKDGSPALELGIKQIDIIDKVGLTEDYPSHFKNLEN
jgi:hypothetical protein